MRRATLLGAVLCALALVPGAGAITGGQPDGNAHPYVAFVGDPVTREVCSGSFLSPTLLVTAAHCSTTGSLVLVGPGPNGPADGFVPGIFTRDPAFCSECGGGLVGFATHDVAVVQLLFPVQLPRYANLPALGETAGLRNGASVTLTGYGVQGFTVGGGKPEPFGDLTRTTAQAELGTAGRKLDEEFLKVRLNHGGFCFGDSGGPVLRGDTVLAVNSFIVNENRCTGVGYSYRLDTPAARAFLAGFGL
ncbi:MAG TPA: trypsin-like serine protease [Gaiellaceae bacterium]|nr:trypsin-like serine protease [Gaiellaceae bacterium]